MAVLGLIAGSGMQQWHDQPVREERISTPWGEVSAALECFQLGSVPVFQIARHGRPHRIPPHRVNYRANLWALRELGATHVVAVNTVGGLHPEMGPGTLLVPDQIIDLTWGRGHTYWDDGDSEPRHVDFTEPYSAPLRRALLQAASSAAVPMHDGGVYVATQGPRLETAAEIRHLAQMGGHVVGMTGMPEAALARELALPFAALGVVVNWAAGLYGSSLDFIEIEHQQSACIKDVARVLWRLTDELTNFVT